jgi:hypothetical protein
LSGEAVQALRGVGAGRVVVGLLTLVAVSRDDVPVFDSLPPMARTAARVLAVRDLVQGASLVIAPPDRLQQVADLGSVVDGVHGMSMLPLIKWSPRYRTAAASSAMSALAWVAVTRLARRS